MVSQTDKRRFNTFVPRNYFKCPEHESGEHYWHSMATPDDPENPRQSCICGLRREPWGEGYEYSEAP